MSGPVAKPVANVQDLHVGFQRRGDTVQALRGVSLEVRPGEILGLVGESGSGKTVLGLTLLGLLQRDPAPVTSGNVEVLGTNVLTAPEHELRRLRRTSLGAVFQDPTTSLDPTMTIGRQVEEARSASSRPAIELLDLVGIPRPEKRLRAYPHELSGGQLQRIMIAMAIASDPLLVVADEPTTALDVTVQKQILELIRTVRDEIGCAFLFVTHDLGVAREVTDRMVVLYSGRVMEEAPSADLLSQPFHPYTLGLLATHIDMDARRERPLVTLAGAVPDPASPPPGCPFSPRCLFHIDDCDRSIPEPLGHGRNRVVACIRTETFSARSSEITLPAEWAQPETQDRSTIVDLLDVHKSYPIRKGLRHKEQVFALRGVSLSIRRGEAVALVGESGCGKTTLLRVAAGLVKADHGSVTVSDGTQAQAIFQDAVASLTPWMSVGELISERLVGQAPRAQHRELVQRALERVGLRAEVMKARPKQLSGGQAQRVAIARAIVRPPEVLFADEPTSSLDVSVRATVLNLLGELRRELQMALLFVTHDLASARVVADRIAVMYAGRIVEFGSAETVIDTPAHPYTRALLASIPGIDAADTAIGEPSDPTAPPAGCAYHPRCQVAVSECLATMPEQVVVADSEAHTAACLLLGGG